MNTFAINQLSTELTTLKAVVEIHKYTMCEKGVPAYVVKECRESIKENRKQIYSIIKRLEVIKSW